MINSFDTAVAMDVGINAAILYKNIQFWCEKNKTNEQNFYDGYYWTYNSLVAFCSQFPYLTKRQVEVALKTLEEKGYIKSGNFNKVLYDRTKWYADIKNVKSISHECEMDCAKMGNGNHIDVKPIPDINTDIETDDNLIPPISPQEEVISKEQIELDSMFKLFWASYPKKVDKKGCERKFVRIKNLKEIFPDIMQALETQKRSKQWNEENGKYIPHPSTWINQERWTASNDMEKREQIASGILKNRLSNYFS